MKSGLRETLRGGRPSFGSWLQFGHPGIAEAMAQAGFEWIGIDLEHSVISLETAFTLIQVIELSGCVPLVRLSANDPVQAKRVMDAGAHGVIVPAVQTVDGARRAVASVKYPPSGARGVGLGRAHAYGPRFADYVRELEEFAVVVVMIEHKDAVERVEEILGVSGIDAVFVGPYDLSASYGIPGQFEHRLMHEALARILGAAKTAGIAPGIHVVHPPISQVRDRVAEGFRFIAYGGDMLFLVPAARAAAAELRGLHT